MKSSSSPKVAVIGAGPAGLIAAEVLSRAGASVTVYDRMPSLARKLLMAGRGGLNLTHSEPFARVVERYGAASGRLRPMLEAFSPAALNTWAEELGQPTFIGSSGRIFPKALKASPLLRAWLARLSGQGVTFQTRMHWAGWNETGDLIFDGPEGRTTIAADAVVLALGGASWPRLGSDGGWTKVLAQAGVPLTPFRPANSGFNVAWSDTFRDRFAGSPLKSAGLSFGGQTVRGEMMIAGYGVEGGAVYALSAPLRDALETDGSATLMMDLRPEMSVQEIAVRLAKMRPGESLSNGLRKALALSPMAVNLLREAYGKDLPKAPEALAPAIKALPITLTGMQGLERAISTAGGVEWDAVDDGLMLKERPGVFIAGEMLDWEAPTGGYLLQACFSTGMKAARGALAHLANA